MKKRILVFPCGTEIGLEINNALKYSKDFELFGASSAEDHGRLVYKNFIGGIPYFNDDAFLTKLNEVIVNNNIDFIFPAHDDVVLILAKIEDQLACELIGSSYKTCAVCRSKSKTYKLFPEISPMVCQKPEDVKEFPAFIKPDIGQGSQGARKVSNMEELLFHVNEDQGLIILEYLPGKEYTVDCFTNRKGELLFAGMRERIRTRNGISVNSKTRKPIIDKAVEKIAREINKKLELKGIWFFQIKLDINNEFKLLEIAPRVAGTMCLYRNDGVNFEQLSIYDKLGYDVSILNNGLGVEVDRALISRFIVELDYDRVYIDFDDTLVVDGTVNTLTMQFIYQCLNSSKDIILVTKHKDDISQTLKKYKIDKNIFNKIVSLETAEEKSSHILQSNKSIFIDDSFSERAKIKNTFGVPCFDLDMIESLIDWRR